MKGTANFEQKDLHGKIKTLYFEGLFITSIRYYGYKINLYILNDTYYEVFYSHKDDRIEKVIKLNMNHSRMKFYTDQIKFDL